MTEPSGLEAIICSSSSRVAAAAMASAAAATSAAAADADSARAAAAAAAALKTLKCRRCGSLQQFEVPAAVEDDTAEDDCGEDNKVRRYPFY